MSDIAMATLSRLGWEWHQHGAVLTLQTDQGPSRVFVPLRRLWITFSRVLPKVPGVGAPQTIGGFFSFVRKAAKKVSRVAKRVRRRVVPRFIRKAADRVARGAKRVLLSKTAGYVAAGLGTAIPALAPAAGAFVAAQAMAKRLAAAERTAKQILGGARTTSRMASSLRQGTTVRRAMRRYGHQARAGNPAAMSLMGAFSRLAS